MVSQPDTQTEKQVGKFEVNVSGEEQSTPPMTYYDPEVGV